MRIMARIVGYVAFVVCVVLLRRLFPWRGGILRPYEGNFETHEREL